MNAAGSVLLDTNVVVAHFRGDSDLTARLAAASALYLPWVVAGELHYGAHQPWPVSTNCPSPPETGISSWWRV
jgi:predicted nucleic acid-binding protein